MFAYLRDIKTFRTLKKAPVLASSLVEDALQAENTTVTVSGTEIGNAFVGYWLQIDGKIYSITAARPQTDRTLLTLCFPMDVFKRSLELPVSLPKTVGGFIAQVLQDNWVEVYDLEYAMPYLRISNSDDTPLVLPEVDQNGLFDLPTYLRQMRTLNNIVLRFRVDGFALSCTISSTVPANRQISFADGRSQLQEVTYSSSGVSKYSVIQDIDTGEKDAAGEAILDRQRFTWYLAEDGTISQSVPPRRAAGSWGTLVVSGKDDVAVKVAEAFAKNKYSHKLVFLSSIDLQVGDMCKFVVYGQTLSSKISYKAKTSTDRRYLYKSGELAATATEKLKGALKK